MTKSVHQADRSPRMIATDKRIIGALEDMLMAGEDITARAVIRRVDGLGAASSITRDSVRRKMISDYQLRQNAVRQHQKSIEKQQRDHSAILLERKQREIAELKQQVATLTASHRALIQAAGEIGAINGWRRMFKGYEHVFDTLEKLGAIPSAEVKRLRPPPRQGEDS